MAKKGKKKSVTAKKSEQHLEDDNDMRILQKQLEQHVTNGDELEVPVFGSDRWKLPTGIRFDQTFMVQCHSGGIPYSRKDFQDGLGEVTDLKEIVSLGPYVTNDKWLITVSSKQLKEEILAKVSIKVKSLPCKIEDLPVEKNVEKVPIYEEVVGRVHWLPYEVPDGAIVQELSKFVDVMTIKMETCTTAKGLKHCLTNVRFVVLKLRKFGKRRMFGIPHEFKVLGAPALLVIMGREPLCLKCKKNGHTKRTCEELFCKKCRSLGHQIMNCKKPDEVKDPKVKNVKWWNQKKGGGSGKKRKKPNFKTRRQFPAHVNFNRMLNLYGSKSVKISLTVSAIDGKSQKSKQKHRKSFKFHAQNSKNVKEKLLKSLGSESKDDAEFDEKVLQAINIIDENKPPKSKKSAKVKNKKSKNVKDKNVSKVSKVSKIEKSTKKTVKSTKRQIIDEETSESEHPGDEIDDEDDENEFVIVKQRPVKRFEVVVPCD